MQLTLDRPEARKVAVELRREWPQLGDPLIMPWSAELVLALDRGRPWLFGPLERDPQRTARGHTVLPRREIRLLRETAGLGVPFQRLATAHELDPGGAVADLLPVLRDGPRRCTDAVALAVVGPPPAHPVARCAARALDTVTGRATTMTKSVTTSLDPIVFGVIGLPEVEDGETALWFPLAVWTW
jgi:hypothetical protein